MKRRYALAPEEASAWARDGYFVREASFTPDECNTLIAAAERAAADASARVSMGETYLLDGKRFVDCEHVTVQFEHSPGSEDIKVIEPVNAFDPAFEALIDDPRITAPIRGLLTAETLSLWTAKLNLKRPGVGSGFGWHQDSPYWIHDHDDVDHLPNVMVTFDDADAANGALAILIGSHRNGCLPGTDDGSQLGGFYTDPAAIDGAAEVVIEAPAGSLIFFSPHIVHGSRPNKSARPRRAMVITYQSGLRPTLKSRSLREVL